MQGMLRFALVPLDHGLQDGFLNSRRAQTFEFIFFCNVGSQQPVPPLLWPLLSEPCREWHDLPWGFRNSQHEGSDFSQWEGFDEPWRSQSPNKYHQISWNKGFGFSDLFSFFYMEVDYLARIHFMAMWINLYTTSYSWFHAAKEGKRLGCDLLPCSLPRSVSKWRRFVFLGFTWYMKLRLNIFTSTWHHLCTIY